MKANELQIGDYVNYRGQIIKVTSLYDKGGSNEIGWSDKESVWVNGRCIEPIPLTPEILEKNGFVENRGVTSWKFETDREDLIDIYGVKDYHLSINIEDTHGSGKGYRWMLSNLTIFYVHQLQHALRLCGIEKEIIL